MPRRVPLIDMEELADSTHPVYMRDAATYRAYVKEVKQREADAMMYGHKLEEKPPEPKWKVCDLNLNAWQENNMDGNSIYNIRRREATILDESKLPPKSHPPTPPDADLPPWPEDLDTQRERRYIRGSQRTALSADVTQLKRLLANTMQEYNKPINGLVEDSYGFPRHNLDVRNLLPRKPKFETVTRMPAKVGSYSKGPSKHVDPTTGQFCEILGPATCMGCIECINRQMAQELQASSFPEVSCSMTSLVGPKLARLLTEMDLKRYKKTHGKDKGRSSSRQNGRKHGILKLPTVGLTN